MYPSRLGRVYKRALVVPPSSPHQRVFVCVACTGTAQVGVSLVSLFDPLFKQSRFLFRCMFDMIFVTNTQHVILVPHKRMMTIPTPPVKTTPWYATLPDCCTFFFAGQITRLSVCTCCARFVKHMMMTYQQFPRIWYVMHAV